MSEERGKRKRMSLFCIKLVSGNCLFLVEIVMADDEEVLGGFSSVPSGIIVNGINYFVIIIIILYSRIIIMLCYSCDITHFFPYRIQSVKRRRRREYNVCVL